jgi:hypothetical protein
MICKQCPGNTLAYPSTKEFEVDLEVAQTAFAKLMDMPLKQLNKSQWYDEFSNRMMFQPIIGFLNSTSAPFLTLPLAISGRVKNTLHNF